MLRYLHTVRVYWAQLSSYFNNFNLSVSSRCNRPQLWTHQEFQRGRRMRSQSPPENATVPITSPCHPGKTTNLSPPANLFAFVISRYSLSL